MNIRIVLIYLFIVVCARIVPAQPLSKIKKKWEKGDLEKSALLAKKALTKDTTAFGSHFFLSLYYLDSIKGRYQPDSARYWVEEGLGLRDLFAESQRKAFEKAQLSPSVLDTQNLRIVRVFYRSATESQDIDILNRFMNLFPNAAQVPDALYLRDSLAYSHAELADQWEDYKDFMDTYPTSVFYESAKKNYEVRLFKKMTGGGDLESYVRFLENYPETPFRKQVEETIFLQKTLHHRASDYLDFLRKYPKTHLKKRISDLVYYLSKSDSSLQDELWKYHPDTDSLRQIRTLEAKRILPLIKENQYHFFDVAGNDLNGLTYDEIPAQYLCNALTSEWVIGSEKGSWSAKNRLGHVLVKDFISVEELGGALMLVDFGLSKRIIHKSGFDLFSFTVNDAFIVFDQWIAFKKDLLWGLASFNGEIVIQPTYRSIEVDGKFLIFETSKGFYISSVAAALEKNIIQERLLVNDYELLMDTLVLGFKGDLETIIDSNLKSILPPETYKIYWQPEYCFVRRPSGISQLFDPSLQSLVPSPYLSVYENDNWKVLLESAKWKVILKSEGTQIQNIDSLTRISDHHLLLHKGDSSFVLFPNGTKVVPKKETFSPMASRNEGVSSNLALLSGSKSKKIYDGSGNQLLDGNYDAVYYLNDTTFVVKSKGKEGVIDSEKHVILRSEYDLIEGHQGMIVLLKKNQIGCLDLQNNVFIPPLYQARVERFGRFYRVTKDVKTGLITGKNKVVAPMEYDDLMIWNDSSFWAKKGVKWQLRGFDGSILMDNISDIQKWEANPELSLYVFLQDARYGIAHPTNGIVIPAKYNDIVNVGSPKAPIFFAEQHLETAEFFVVTYFNLFGVPFRSQAFRSEEYDKIYCDQSEVSSILVE